MVMGYDGFVCLHKIDKNRVTSWYIVYLNQRQPKDDLGQPVGLRGGVLKRCLPP